MTNQHHQLDSSRKSDRRSSATDELSNSWDLKL